MKTIKILNYQFHKKIGVHSLKFGKCVGHEGGALMSGISVLL